MLYSYFWLIYFSEFNDSFFVKYATIAEVEVEKQQTDKQLDDKTNNRLRQININDCQKYFIDFDLELY